MWSLKKSSQSFWNVWTVLPSKQYEVCRISYFSFHSSLNHCQWWKSQIKILWDLSHGLCLHVAHSPRPRIARCGKSASFRQVRHIWIRAVRSSAYFCACDGKRRKVDIERDIERTVYSTIYSRQQSLDLHFDCQCVFIRKKEGSEIYLCSRRHFQYRKASGGLAWRVGGNT